jgi:uncharacterized protein YndB with AHSA1/START domain
MSFIKIQTQINAPVSKVYEFWTTPSHMCSWNFASPDWHCPSCDIDLKVDGKLKAVMAAKDGSMSFDFNCTYDEIIPNEKLSLTIEDERKWLIYFKTNEEGTLVTEEFEPENVNPIEMQQMGWQSILDNFKSYVESKKYEKLNFEIHIDAPRSHVFETMLGSESYKEWTSVFTSTSHYVGEWKKGSKIRFQALDKDGKISGMHSIIDEVIPNEFVSIQHLGEIVNNEEVSTGGIIDSWTGSHENYYYTEDNDGTKLVVSVDSLPDYFSFFNEQYPLALQKLKSICER